MKWNSFEYRGEEYELTHLNPFQWEYKQKKEVKHPERIYRFNIRFSMHCFTTQASQGTDNALIYSGPKETRQFCFERYELSKQLADVIRNINNKTCWHTRHGNFFTIEIQDQEGKKKDYEIYFKVHKSEKGWLTLIVQSAYIRDENHSTTQPRKRKVRFSVIARTKMDNKKLRPPR